MGCLGSPLSLAVRVIARLSSGRSIFGLGQAQHRIAWFNSPAPEPSLRHLKGIQDILRGAMDRLGLRLHLSDVGDAPICFDESDR